MLTTGNQLKAARMLSEIDQAALAALVGVNVNTIRNMEASGPAAIAGRSTSVQAVQRALEERGVEFLNHGQPGVRLAKRSLEMGNAARSIEQKASADDVRAGAADAADRVLADVDATKQEKAERRAALTDDPAVIARARGKVQGRKP